jgi:hypothetical protein
MKRQGRALLDKLMSHLQSRPRRDGMLILVMISVFPSMPTALDDGRIALAFLLNGTANTARQQR